MTEHQAKLADFMRRYESKLPRPENYRKKTTGALQRALQEIDEDLQALPEVPEFVAMAGRRRRHILEVLASRMVVKGGESSGSRKGAL